MLRVTTTAHLAALHQVVIRGEGLALFLWVHGDDARAAAVAEQARRACETCLAELRACCTAPIDTENPPHG